MSEVLSQKSTEDAGLPIHEFGIGRIAMCPWLEEIEEDLKEILPDDQIFIPRVQAGVSYISGHKIANLKGFSEHKDTKPDKLITALVSLISQNEGILDYSNEYLPLPKKGLIIGSQPKKEGYRLAIKVSDIRDGILFSERVALETHLLGRQMTKKPIRTPSLILGSISATQGTIDENRIQRVLKHTLPNEVILDPLGPIDYRLR
jgi:hypothetical protein